MDEKQRNLELNNWFEWIYLRRRSIAGDRDKKKYETINLGHLYRIEFVYIIK